MNTDEKQRFYNKINELLNKKCKLQNNQKLEHFINQKQLLELTQHGDFIYIDDDLTITLLLDDDILVCKKYYNIGEYTSYNYKQSRVYKTVFNKERKTYYICFSERSDKPEIFVNVVKKDFLCLF